MKKEDVENILLSMDINTLSNFYGKDYFDGEKGNMKSNYTESNWNYLKKKAIIDARIIVKYFSPVTALDIGCAKGFLVEELRKSGVESFGIDISEYVLSQVSKDIKMYVKQADIRKLPNEWKGMFDFVSIFHTLEHIPEQHLLNVIKEISKISKDVICIEVPISTRGIDNDITHMVIREFDYWKDLIEKEGFFKFKEMKIQWRSYHTYAHNLSGWKIFQRVYGIKCRYCNSIYLTLLSPDPDNPKALFRCKECEKTFWKHEGGTG